MTTQPKRTNMAEQTTRELTTFSVEYYKPSGKFYTESSFSREVQWINETPNMNHAASYIRGLRDAGGQDSLPGLSGEGWDGFIRIDHPDGFPVLILPHKT